MNVLCVEYPGYGSYPGRANEEEILKDTLIVYDFITRQMKIHFEDVILLGRSIGTGPAIHLASLRKVGALILISPYTCIRDLVQCMYGKFFAYIVKDRFRNIDKIEFIECPALFIHGKKDKLIGHNLSEQLAKKCKTFNQVVLPEEMEHSSLNMERDIILNIRVFFSKIKMKLTPIDEILDTNKIIFPSMALEEPSINLKEESVTANLKRNVIYYLFFFGLLMKLYKIFFSEKKHIF